MRNIERPKTVQDKLPRKLKKALRAKQHGGGTRRQQMLASALLRKELRITVPYVGFNECGEYLVVSEYYRPRHPPIEQTLQALTAELKSYGYELLSKDADDHGRVDSYTFHLPLMVKCVNGHYTPYKKVSRRQPCCDHCGETLWGSPQRSDVLLWQGVEYAPSDPATLPVPDLIEIFYDFNGTERPKPSIPPRGRRRRRYMKALRRWSDLQRSAYHRATHV